MADAEVIFVLGCPGAGKGTQCSKIVERFGYEYLSVGDLLRDEKRRNSENGQLIGEIMNEGKVVPAEITCTILRNKMEELIQNCNGKKAVFLIDGFPRDRNNLDGWNAMLGGVVSLRFVLFLNCSEEICAERLRSRAKTSGRKDDSDSSIQKRLDVYKEESKPVIDYFKKIGKVKEVDTRKDAETIFGEIKRILENFA